jgi:hypothetical protein
MTTEINSKSPTPSEPQAPALALDPGSAGFWRSPEAPPELTGVYLAMTSEGPEILKIEETYMEYGDGTFATFDEILAWAEIPPLPNAKDEPRRKRARQVRKQLP